MRVIKSSYEIITPIDGLEIDGLDILRLIESVGRVCYKSEDKITEDSSRKFVKMLIDRGHEAMLEHYSFTVKFICDRGVSHEIVRHRLASYAQESTRYCNYVGDKFENQITVIKPCFWEDKKFMTNSKGCLIDISKDKAKWNTWLRAMEITEDCYLKLIEHGASPQEARSVLPNSLKTELIMTANLREWRHFLKLRTADTAHPQMLEITRPLLGELKMLIPVVFDDITF